MRIVTFKGSTKSRVQANTVPNQILQETSNQVKYATHSLLTAGIRNSKYGTVSAHWSIITGSYFVQAVPTSKDYIKNARPCDFRACC